MTRLAILAAALATLAACADTAVTRDAITAAPAPAAADNPFPGLVAN